MKPLECIAGVCALDEIIEEELEEGQRLWSKADSWPNGIPKEGEDVEIVSGWNMIYDLEESPKLGTLTINGRLTFKNNTDHDLHLRVGNIFIRAGELFIGSEEYPFTKKATITLLGGSDATTVTLGSTIEAGNKALAIVGSAHIHGSLGTKQWMTRLAVPVNQGESQIIIPDGHNWAVGDKIFLAASTIAYKHSEYRTITEVIGGLVTLDEPLNHYHWGAGSSTAPEYNGVDMRTEVILLSRNILIQGEDLDGWGGQIIVSDTFEMDGTWRKGSLYMSNVELFRMSQKDAFHSAIRWEGAKGGHSKVSNCAIHHGLDWGTMIW